MFTLAKDGWKAHYMQIGKHNGSYANDTQPLATSAMSYLLIL